MKDLESKKEEPIPTYEIEKVVNIRFNEIKLLFMKGEFNGKMNRTFHGLTFVFSALFKDNKGKKYMAFTYLDEVEFDFKKATGQLTILGKR